MSQFESNIPDAGPWRHEFNKNENELVLYSDDFNHDVMMRINGDFGEKSSKEAYGKYISEILNKGCARAKALELAGKGSIQEQMEKAIFGPQGEFIAEIAAEMANMKIALEHADRALEQFNASKYLRNKVKEASSISPLAEALQNAISKQTKK